MHTIWQCHIKKRVPKKCKNDRNRGPRVKTAVEI